LDRYIGALPKSHPDLSIREQPWDPVPHMFSLFWDVPVCFQNISRAKNDHKLMLDFAKKCVTVGTVKMAVDFVREFAALPSAAGVLPVFGCVLNMLQSVAQVDGGAQVILTSSSSSPHPHLILISSSSHPHPTLTSSSPHPHLVLTNLVADGLRRS